MIPKTSVAIFFCLLILLVSPSVGAQESLVFPPQTPKVTLSSLETDEVIKIDGIMDEQSWKEAPTSEQFTQVEPMQGEAPNQETKIKILFDEKFLYFGVICLDSLGKKAIRATDFKRDFNFQTHDLVTLCIDGFNDERNAMSFAVNPYGVQRDYLSYDARYYDIEWDGLWKTRTSRTDSGWVAEIAIPWRTLRYPETGSALQDWTFQMYRNRRLTNEITAFSPFPRSFSAARMDYAGKILNLSPPPPKTNVRIKPFVLSSRNVRKTEPVSNRIIDANTKIGGELKWAINPNDVLDFTINTDFAQADADRQINNITRFSVFFPERRQFFLENASLFGANVGSVGFAGGPMRIQPFFSRRIGLDDGGRPIPIDVGARYVHRSSDQNYGAMLIRQRDNEFTPSTNFLISRYSKNFGAQNRIGGILTVKNNEENTNTTGSIDGFFRIGDSQTINTLLSYSSDSQVSNNGLSAIAQYVYSGNKWQFWWTQSIVSASYNPEVGFVSRSDVIGTTPGVVRNYRGDKLPFKKIIRAFEPSIYANIFHRASTGELIEREITSFPIYFNFQNGGFAGYGFSVIYQNIQNSFKPLGITIAAEEYNYSRQYLFAGSDPSKKISAFARVIWGSYFNGNLRETDLTLSFIPIPHISLAAKINSNYFSDVGQDNLTKSVNLFSLESRFAINPRIQLSGLYQRNSGDNLENINIRFSWEYQPLSFIYFVYNSNSFDIDDEVRQIENQLIGKIGYLRQF